MPPVRSYGDVQHAVDCRPAPPAVVRRVCRAIARGRPRAQDAKEGRVSEQALCLMTVRGGRALFTPEEVKEISSLGADLRHKIVMRLSLWYESDEAKLYGDEKAKSKCISRR